MDRGSQRVFVGGLREKAYSWYIDRGRWFFLRLASTGCEWRIVRRGAFFVFPPLRITLPKWLTTKAQNATITYHELQVQASHLDPPRSRGNRFIRDLHGRRRA